MIGNMEQEMIQVDPDQREETLRSIEEDDHLIHQEVQDLLFEVVLVDQAAAVDLKIMESHND